MDALRDPSSITERQRQVIQLIAAGRSNEEVGRELGISPRTAKAHCDTLRLKLGVRRRRQIPLAYRLQTGDDPLAESLESAEADTGAKRLRARDGSPLRAWIALGVGGFEKPDGSSSLYGERGGVVAGV